MTEPATQMERHVQRWWLWFGVAIFLLIPMDLLTTLLAVRQYGIAVEANPIMRWLLGKGLFVVTVVNLVVAGLVIFLFHVAIARIRQVPPSHRSTLIYVVNGWIGLLVVAGVVLVTNNLLVIV